MSKKLMLGIPDFAQIAQSFASCVDPAEISKTQLVEDIAEQLRLVWNARGVADAYAVAFNSKRKTEGDVDAIMKLDR